MDLIFPRLVYRSPAVHKLVSDAEGFDAARVEGWFASVPEALAGAHADATPLVLEPEQPDDAPPTREEMEQKAAELGIKADGRWSDKRLADAIAAKLGAKA